MGIDGIGSSVVIALAAVLWFIYLVPTWLKRREYLSTERNAVRLQQTVRIMAESAEVPDVVRVEANARGVAEQRALLNSQARAAAIAASADRAAARAPGSLRAHRLRRARGAASLVLLASLIATGFGVSLLVSTGAWVLVAASATVGVGAFALLGQLAAVGKSQVELTRVQRSAPVAQPLRDHAPVEASQAQAGWTPVPIPKPLYLSHPVPATRLTAAPAVSASDASAGLRAAAAKAERELREAQSSPEVKRISAPPVAPAASTGPSRFATMGIVDSADAQATDLDDILRRRRA